MRRWRSLVKGFGMITEKCYTSYYMNMPSSKSTGDVFEMILDRAGNETLAMQANPSFVSIPADWQSDHHEGQLAVDVAEGPTDIFVISPMAGADTNRIEIYVHNDMLTIRGLRASPLDEQGRMGYFCQECFWGAFSRTIVLPVHVKGDLARAEYKNGVLTVRIPKRDMHAHVPVTIVEE
jgi:HSP20 family protein